MVKSRDSQSSLEEGEIRESPPRKGDKKDASTRASKTPSPPGSRKSSAARSPAKESPARNARAKTVKHLPKIPKKTLTATEQDKRQMHKTSKDRVKANIRAREDARKPPPQSPELTRAEKAALTRAKNKEKAKMVATTLTKKINSKPAAAAKKSVAATTGSGRTMRSAAPPDPAPPSPNGTAAGRGTKTGRVKKSKSSASKSPIPTENERSKAIPYRFMLVAVNALLKGDDEGAFGGVRAHLQSIIDDLDQIAQQGERGKARGKKKVLSDDSDLDEPGEEEQEALDDDDDADYEDEDGE